MLRIWAHQGTGWDAGDDPDPIEGPAGAEPMVAPDCVVAWVAATIDVPIAAGAVAADCVADGIDSTEVTTGATSLGAVAGILGTVCARNKIENAKLNKPIS